MMLRLALVVLLSVGGASALCARPVLEKASPGAGSTVARAPSQVVLTFTERLSPSGSDVVVRDASGAVVSAGKARVVGNKSQMEVPLKPLTSGKYRVEWYVISADKHQSQGSFAFSVGNNEPVKRRPRPPGRQTRPRRGS